MQRIRELPEAAHQTLHKTMPAVRMSNFPMEPAELENSTSGNTCPATPELKIQINEKGVAGLVLMPGVVFAFDAPPSPY
ncbi:hypothetical protein [Niastella populi]|uniref:Uncharacterized protein n=1 Tax=Niastella populi TaxID=550983 RepID=A0A1V9GB10_9BACT|nr:hypothetical protein [Niastella populi]OQP67849.1 hypothetical protein A4R26_10100 [Niastella populi]